MRQQPAFQYAAQSMSIDASVSETFIIEMGTSIQQLSMKNVTPGVQYIFILRQNHVGGHTILWGSTIRNGGALDPRPFAVTVQSYLANADGTLAANLPASWTGN
jgi:hypothetical protein